MDTHFSAGHSAIGREPTSSIDRRHLVRPEAS